jgi:hypothetical protein
MPTSSAGADQTAAQSGRDAAHQPWLHFFREVRRLAAKLDALEATGNGDNEE